MRYLTLSELIYVNGKVLNNTKILSGKQQIRDQALLEAAAARPTTSAFGQDAYPTLGEKVAALFHSLVRNHPFTDGNKRTATVAAVFMLHVNGQCPAWTPHQALEVIMLVAQGTRSLQDFAGWLPLEPCAESLVEDAEKDMLLIDRIIEEHHWLLDELKDQ